MKPLLLIIIISMMNLMISHAQNGWSVNTSVQLTSGDYISGNTTNNYYFNFGSRYRSDGWYISGNISLIGQSGPALVSETSDMMGGISSSHMNFGLGDLFLFGEINIMKGTGVLPRMSLSGQVKFPLANTDKNLGTGELDFGIGLTMRKTVLSFIAFGDIGYLNLGDPEGITYLNPLTFGFGLGKGFNYGKYSISIYYQRYSRIFENYAAPHQLSIGLYANIVRSTYLSIIGSKVLSETTPNFSISAGLEYNF